MVIIKGRQYPKGVHTIDGERIQVIDAHTYRSLGKADEPETVELERTTGRININECRASDLELLEGVSAATADRIVAARPFEEIEDLARVKGIGQRTIDLNRDRIVA